MEALAGPASSTGSIRRDDSSAIRSAIASHPSPPEQRPRDSNALDTSSVENRITNIPTTHHDPIPTPPRSSINRGLQQRLHAESPQTFLKHGTRRDEPDRLNVRGVVEIWGIDDEDDKDDEVDDDDDDGDSNPTIIAYPSSFVDSTLAVTEINQENISISSRQSTAIAESGEDTARNNISHGGEVSLVPPDLPSPTMANFNKRPAETDPNDRL